MLFQTVPRGEAAISVQILCFLDAVAVLATPPVVSDRQPVITEGALAVLRSRSLRFLVIRAPTGELDLAQLITVDDLAVDTTPQRKTSNPPQVKPYYYRLKRNHVYNNTNKNFERSWSYIESYNLT